MTDVSRRALFGLAGATGVGCLLAGHARPAAAEPADLPKLLKNFRHVHAGNAESNAQPSAAPKLAQIQADGERYLPRLRPPSQWERYSGVINDVRLGLANSSSGAVASGRLTSTFRVLCTISLATAAPGAPWFGDIAKQDQVIQALRWVVENYYSVQGNPYTGEGETYGDWWDWEIGSPNEITRAVAHLYDRIMVVDPGLISLCVAAMDSHLVFEPRFHSGANRADMTLNYLVQGAMLADDARVAEGLGAFLTVTEVVNPAAPVDGITDGFYPDGSFIQHGDVPYTGAYGKNLLTRLTQLVAVMAGTSYDAVAGLPAIAFGWVDQSFSPIIFEGHLLELVKGRIAARMKVGYEDATILAESLSQLCANLPPSEAAALGSFIKHMVLEAEVGVDVADFVSPLAIATFDQLMSGQSVIPGDPFFATGHRPFNSMERTVHGRPGFRFAIARSSSRVAKYEILSGANPRPWFQGEGAYYLYLAGQDQARTYGGEYLHVVHPTKLAGITAQVGEERQQSGNSPLGTNDHSGGVDVGGYGSASQRLGHEFNLTYLNPEGVKSWFMFDDEIVVLGADITEPAGRELQTSVDTRMGPAGSNPQISWIDVSGNPGFGPVSTASLRQARWHDPDSGAAVGYVFLDGNEISIESGLVTASGPAMTRMVSNLFYRHPGSVPSSHAYVIVPNADEAGLSGYQDDRLSILANSAAIQGVTHTSLGVTMVNFFTEGAVASLASDGPAGIVIVSNQDGTARVGISDPTFLRPSSVVRLNEPGLQLVHGDPGVHVVTSSDGVEITVDTEDAMGKVFRLELLDLQHAMVATEEGFAAVIEANAFSPSVERRLSQSLRSAGQHWDAGRRHSSHRALQRFARELEPLRSSSLDDREAVESLVELVAKLLVALANSPAW